MRHILVAERVNCGGDNDSTSSPLYQSLPTQGSDRWLTMKDHGIFWWVFATRGGFAILFALLLFHVRSLVGTFFSDPILAVTLGMLLGFYVLGNGILLGVATAFAFERRLRFGWLLFSECLFAILLGLYISFLLVATPPRIAVVAGIHALGAGFFQASLTFRVGAVAHAQTFIAVLAVIALFTGCFFLVHRGSSLREISEWLTGFELLYGIATVSLALQLRKLYIPNSR